MGKQLVKQIIVLITFFIPLAALSQSCSCSSPKEPLYSDEALSLCGNIHDSSGMGKIIAEFVLCYRDSVMADHFHNEGASFLFCRIGNKFSFTGIDLEYSNGKFIYPETFYRVVYSISRGKIKEEIDYVKAAPIVVEMEKNYKELRKIY